VAGGGNDRWPAESLLLEHVGAAVIDLSGTDGRVRADVVVNALVQSRSLGDGLRIRGLRVDDRLVLSHLAIDDVIEFVESVLADVDLTGLRCRRLAFCRCRLGGVRGQYLDVTNDVDLSASELVEVHLDRARIGGALAARSSEVTGSASAGVALSLMETRIGGTLDATEARVAGAVHLGGAIDGSVELGRMQVAFPQGDAIHAAGLAVGGRVSLQGAVIEGATNFNAARIGGRFDAIDARLSSSSSPSLRLKRAKVDDSVVLRGATCHGPVLLSNMTIRANLELDSVTVHGPARDSIDLRDTVVEGRASLAHMRTDEPVSLVDFEVRGELDIESSSLAALFCRGARANSLRVNEVASPCVNLRDARARTFHDVRQDWATVERLRLEGFVYDQLSAPEQRTWQDRARWLSRQEFWSPEPYHHLARIWRSHGRERDARKLLVAAGREQLRRSKRNYPGPGRPVQAGTGERLRLRVLRLIGFGYEPWWALIPALVLVAIGSLLVAGAVSNEQMVHSERPNQTAVRCPDAPQCIAPWLYSLDTLLPIVDLHQESTWTPDPRDRWGRATMYWRWITIALGWALTSLVVAGFTSLVRRE
jgi:hypothetical protein